MLLPDRDEPADEIVPGLIGSLNPRLPSTRDSEPPMPARTPPPTQVVSRAVDPEVGSTRLVLFLAWFVFVVAQEPGIVESALLYLVVWMVPAKVLDQLVPKRLKRATTIQSDSGDTWITRVPSIRAEADRSPVRLPFRVMSAVVALVFMLPAMIPINDLQLFERIAFFLGGMVFGGIALVPGGDLKRMVPRFSSHPRLPAPGDDAGAG
ncbi:hypothetical protein [Longimicrobium sp.]|uniref:hypothetical protein n=1 Tax=Longimicrobium sp. TaxID=2029185 RepID=UPI002BF26796|nr:hypothetical protein [Longimicrobium sp.]HSU14897.1 hypothetical protein [Longimicrobium sp.]